MIWLKKGWRTALVLAVLALVSLVVPACGDDDAEGASDDSAAATTPEPTSDGTPAETPTVDATGEPILVGVVGPLTMTQVRPLIDQLLGGMNAYFGYVNEELGGIAGRPIEVVTGDDNADPNTALTIATRLVEEDGVVAFPLVTTTPSYRAVAPYAMETQTPILTAAAGLLSFTDPVNPFTFSAVVPNEVVGAAAAQFLIEEHGVETLALTSVSDSTGLSFLQGFETYASEHGASVSDLLFDRSVSEYSAQSRELASIEPDGVFCAAPASRCASIISGALDLGLETIWLMDSAATNAQLPELLGADVADGMFGLSGYLPPDSDDPGVASFRMHVETYASGTQLSPFTQTGYVVARVLSDALMFAVDTSGEIDGVAVRDALEQLDVDYGMLEPFALSTEDHLMNQSVHILQFQADGSIAPIDMTYEVDLSQLEPFEG